MSPPKLGLSAVDNHNAAGVLESDVVRAVWYRCQEFLCTIGRLESPRYRQHDVGNQSDIDSVKRVLTPKPLLRLHPLEYQKLMFPLFVVITLIFNCCSGLQRLGGFRYERARVPSIQPQPLLPTKMRWSS
ncbi:hypothetical protein GALMADRAFT_460288 [Galerina marginata CBS 339.88]|uniref:Uncharacterized protein n=1 Tax=Galerina marginata (strain CBS 339.88) TaxID=685588 RepID=A0A067SYS6_GALM3|nr:hypothetical protein GALMADRAFT_460288 [Galerina marginata CBS 339.88]